MKPWNELSMAEKAEMMKVAVRNGIYNLSDIKQRYNEFAEGGSKVGEEEDITDEQYLNTMEKVAEENYKNWGYNNSDEALVHALNDNTYDYRGYYNKYPQSRANADTHWTDEFKTVYHPTFSNESIYSSKKSQYNPYGLPGGFWAGEDENASFIPMAWQAINNQYKSGGGIHIKPSHRGRLTELKKRTGKSEAELYNDGNPAHKKMVVFARNARKWKHGFGGNLFDGTTEDSQQLNVAIPDATYVASTPLFHPISRKDYNWEEAALNRANQVYSNYEDAKDDTMPWYITKMRNGLRWLKDNINEDIPSGVSNCTLTATEWVDPNNPIAHAKSIHTNPEKYGYTKVDSLDAVPGNLLIAINPNDSTYHTMMVSGFAGRDSIADFDGKKYHVKKGEPLLTYSRGGHDNSFLRRNIPISAYTPNSDDKIANFFYRYNYPREVFLPEVIVTGRNKKK